MKAFYSSCNFTMQKQLAWIFSDFPESIIRQGPVMENLSQREGKKNKKMKTGYNLNQTIKLLDKQTLDYNVTVYSGARWQENLIMLCDWTCLSKPNRIVLQITIWRAGFQSSLKLCISFMKITSD